MDRGAYLMSTLNIPDMPLYLDDNYLLRWSESVGAHVRKGDVAGSIHHGGYRNFRYKRKSYLSHRVIFQMHYGYLPRVVDHIDGDTLNNNPLNLRPVTFSQNTINSKTRIDNTSGRKGVTWMEKFNCWHAQINVDGRQIYLGRSKIFEDAVKLREVGEAKYHKEYSRVTKEHI